MWPGTERPAQWYPHSSTQRAQILERGLAGIVGHGGGLGCRVRLDREDPRPRAEDPLDHRLLARVVEAADVENVDTGVGGLVAEATLGEWSCATGCLAPADQPGERRHQLLALLLLVLGLRAQHAVARVVVHQRERDLVEGRLRGADLLEDVDAVAVVLDHPRDPPHLALDAPQAREDVALGAGGRVAGRLRLSLL